MTDTVTLHKEWRRVELLTWHEINEHTPTDASAFDYIDEDERFSPRFAVLPDEYVIDTHDILRATGDIEEDGWDAFDADTFFSGHSVRFLDGDDDGFVDVGRWFA